MNPSIQRRTVLRAALATAAAGAWQAPTHAQTTWPAKAVTLIVPFPAGGGTDAFARPMAAQFARLTGKQLIIDNRGGAGGTLGAGIAAKAAPDGYTLFMGAVHHAIAPAMYPKLDYDLEKDLIPLILVASVPQVVVVNPKTGGNGRLAYLAAWGYALKKSGIKAPADLSGKKLGAPVFDAGRKAFPIFAKANNVSNVAWTSMDPPLRETMLVRGDIDAITGFSFTSILNLEARGVKADEIVTLPYPQYGVKLYGNVVIVGEEFLKKNPEAVKRFLKAFSKGVKDVIADPKAAIATVKARDGIINDELELRRLKMCLDATVLTPDTKAEGFGNALAPRLSLMASQVSDAFGTKERINPTAVWNGTLLPSEADRNIFAVAKK